MPNLSRKEELERKKAKLAALREERLQREAIRRNEEHSTTFPTISSLNNIDPEQILGDLSVRTDGKVTAKLLGTELSKSLSTPTFSTKKPDRRPLKLILSEIYECSIDPQYDEKYSKESQTVSEVPNESPSLATDTWPETPSLVTGRISKGLVSLEWDDEILAGDEDDPLTEHEVPPIPNHLEVDKHVRIQDLPTPARGQPKELTGEEKEEIEASEGFLEFITRASALVEDALEMDDRDIFFDYSGADEEDEVAKAQQMLIEERVFFHLDWTPRRTVTALDWSTVHPEAVLAAYSQPIREEEFILSPVSSFPPPDGVCLVWNLKAKKCESVLTCQTPITTAIFSDFHPNLIIGGTYVGQIVVWDTRVNRQTPVQRTSFAGGSGHCEPIRELAVTGSQTANNLVSVSADGRLCAWSLDMFATPLQTMELVYKQAKSVAPTSVAFAHDFDDGFLVGAQDGCVYGGCRTGSDPGVTEQYEGHSAPITTITIPNANDPLNDTSLYLTASMDCTVKLWSRGKPEPLVTFDDRNEYYLDSDWSPYHPALFATVDLGGHLDIWNLNMNSEVPTTSTVLSENAIPNCCKFETKGSHIAVGDDGGKVRVFTINDKIAAARPDEWTTFERQIQRLKQAAIGEQNSDTLMRGLVYSDL